MPNYCKNCGKRLESEWKACSECGTIFQRKTQSNFPPNTSMYTPTKEIKRPAKSDKPRKINEKTYAIIFLILSFICIVLFIIAAFMPVRVQGGIGFISMAFILGGWEGLIIIIYSVIKIKKNYRNVHSMFKIYIIGIVLIALNLPIMIISISGIMVTITLIIISLIGFTLNLFFLKRLKSLCVKVVDEIDTLLQKYEDWEETGEGKRED